MDCAVIRIRYPDFSVGSRDLAGLHGSAEHDAHGVTVYLLPGLTGRQRKAVIRRLRQEASRGFGPALPLPGLLIALGLDRLRMAAGTAVSIVRLHPTLALLPGAAVAAMTLFVLASAGGALGPATRAGLDGVLVHHGRPASVASTVLGQAVVGPSVAHGGSELGFGALAPVWQARPHGGHRQHDRRPARHDGRPARHDGRPARHDGRPARHDGRPARHHRRRGNGGCQGPRVTVRSRPGGVLADQIPCRPAGS